MQITLKINGQEQIFSNDFVKARVFRNALKMNEKMRKEGNEISVETFDEMISFVVNVFDNQFTIDDVWDGLEAGKLQDEIMRVFNNVLNIGGLETKTALNDAEGKASGITPYQYIKKFYRDLIKEGYKLHEVDEMDIHFWFELTSDFDEMEEVTADEISWL